MRELWLQVLRTGLEDAKFGQEVRWIGSKGFREVCDLAGLEPDHVERHFQHMSKTPARVPERSEMLHM